MPQVAIAGAGLMGRLIGWHLAQRGITATLYEQAVADAPRSAAHVAAAMLAPVSELPEAGSAIFAMGCESLRLWPPILRELGVAHDVRGSLLVAHGPDVPLLDKFYRSLGAHRNEARWLDGAEIERLEPALGGRFRRALLLANEGWVDNRALLAALAERCGEIRYGQAVAPERLHADVVIDCRGAGAALPGLRGVRGEAIRLRAPDVRLHRPVRLMHPRYQLYIAPRPDAGYVVGATQLESESRRQVTVRSALELLSAAFAVHPGFAEAEIVELGVGLRPAYADNLPRVGWQNGVLRVNGLYRHGFLIAPALLKQVAAQIDAGLTLARQREEVSCNCSAMASA